MAELRSPLRLSVVPMGPQVGARTETDQYAYLGEALLRLYKLYQDEMITEDEYAAVVAEAFAAFFAARAEA